MRWLNKDYYILRSICKKANVKLKLHNRVGSASFRFMYLSWLTGSASVVEREVSVCLKDPYLWEGFAHEIGHLLDAVHSAGYNEGSYKYNPLRVGKPMVRALQDYMQVEGNCSDYDKLLFCEARASRIAVKLLKSMGKLRSGSVPHLQWCIGTYTQGVQKDILADVDYDICRYISGKSDRLLRSSEYVNSLRAKRNTSLKVES